MEQHIVVLAETVLALQHRVSEMEQSSAGRPQKGERGQKGGIGADGELCEQVGNFPVDCAANGSRVR